MRKTDLIRRSIICFLVFVLGLSAKCSATYITVATDGSGQYYSIQAAINAAPIATSSANADTIYIKDGKYKEKINIPATKPYIVMIGQSVANTIVTYDDGASTIVGGVALGTQNSASFTIGASDFTALNITFVNAFGDGSQAVAVLVNADRAAFKNCRFLGNQDTLYIKGSGTPKHYFANCYIDGNVDFIFGSSVAVFDTCVIYGKVKPGISSTYITAPNTPIGQAYGIVYRGCQITGNTPAAYYYLGRPWQAAPTAVYLDSKVYGNMIIPAGWSSNSAGTATLNDAYFAEHKSINGNGTLVDTTQRVSQSHQITDALAATYTLANIMGTWNPCAIFNCGSFSPTIAMANMRGAKGAVYDTLRWNISWPITGVQYQLYRSTDSINYTALASQVITAPNDTTWNFQFVDTIPSQGNIYWYYVKATKSGYTANNSDTVKISSAPTILTSGALTAFTQYLGTPSSPQTYTVSGTNLTANVSITPPANYEVSVNGGSTYASTGSLTPVSGTLAATTVYVRLNATALGTYSGNITHTSTGATTNNVAVTGTTVAAPIFTSNLLELWPLDVNNADSASVRSAGVSPTVPTLNRLYNSTAVSVTTIPAYSPTYGNAFGASSTVDGGWGTTSGGPGGNLNRTYYQQFTIKGATGDSLRVDSVVVTSAFYNTSSGTKLAVVYSKTGFVSDSSDVTGGSGPTGALAASANGAFATPILLAQQNTGPANIYRLALNGPLGVKTDTGGTITVRLYFSCSSSSAGRYGMIKNVFAMGDYMAYVACTPPAITATPTAASCGTGGSIALTTTGGTGPFTYVWTGPNSYTSTAQNPTNLVAGTYNVTVTANGGCQATGSAVVGMQAFTTTATALTSATFCQGGSVVLKTSTIAPGYTYYWKNGSVVISGATDTTYTATAAGSYTVTVTNGTCTATSAPVTVTVNAAPVPVVTAGAGTTFCAGGSVTLNANTATGYTYQWRKNGVNIATGGTSASYAATTSGAYKVVITNSNGCSDSSVATTVTVNPAPSTTVTASGSTSFCAGGSVQLCAPTATGVTYQWRNTSGNIGSATAACYTASASNTYKVVVTNTSTGCVDSSTGTVVSANSAPSAVVTPAGPASICQGTSLTLHTNNATGLTYQWKLNGTNVSTGGVDSTYTISAAGSYTVVVSAGVGCTSTSLPVVVSVNALPSVSATAANVACYGACNGSITLTGSGTATPYAYASGTGTFGSTSSFSSLCNGVYVMHVKDANACVKDTTITITQPAAALAATATITTAVNCGSTGTVTVTATGGTTAYQYKLGVNGTYASSGVFSGLTAGTDTFYVKDANNCTASSVVTLTSSGNPPTATITPAGPAAICQGSSIKLHTNNASGLTYQWKLNGNNVPSGGTDSTYVATTAGSYTVVVSAGAGCSATSVPVVITVSPTPTPAINYASGLLSTGAYASYQWKLNGNIIGSATSQYFVPVVGGLYTVTVTDGTGCSGTSAAITVFDLGVNNAAAGLGLKVYPNPTSGIIHVEATVPVNVRLKDVQGRTIVQEDNAKLLDITNLANGFYILVVTDSHGRVISNQRVVKTDK